MSTQNKESLPFVLGIDIAKETFSVALLTTDQTPKHKQFANTSDGFNALIVWLSSQFVSDLRRLHACMEATSHYGDALAAFLVQNQAIVSVVNPAAIRAFGRAEMSRTKTDKADAARIARFCRMHQPKPWLPPAEEQAVLQALVRRLDALKVMHTMERNRVDGASPAVAPSLQAVLTVLDEQITLVKEQIKEHIRHHPSLKEQSDLLTSIPGIGEQTAAVLLAELGCITRFGSAKKAAAFAGLVPSVCESGTSVRARSTLCKMGGSRLRKALYFPALSSLRFNEVIKAMAERLKAAGKSKMAIVGAAMRRLVHLAFGVLKSQKLFDATIAMPNP